MENYTDILMPNTSAFMPTENETHGAIPDWVLELPYDREILRHIFRVYQIILVLGIMMSMGCNIYYIHLFNHFKKPLGIGFGFVCQFLWMPLFGFGLRHVLKLTWEHSLGVMIIATTPGGSISNLFTYWSKGDVPLSISMTTFSTLAAFGMMPLNLYIYHRDTQYTIPYGSIAIALAISVIPVCIGMAVRYKWMHIANKITFIGSRVSLFGILISMTMQILLSPHMFITTSSPYIAAFILPLLGILAGFLSSSVVCLPFSHRRTIAIETGCQNVAMATAVILLSFSGPGMSAVLLIPFLYGISSITTLSIFALVSHALIKIGYCNDNGTSIKSENEIIVNAEKTKNHSVGLSSAHNEKVELENSNKAYTNSP